MAKFFSKLFKDQKKYRRDYGDLFKPPSSEAEAIASSMTQDEQINFRDLLGRLQQLHESASGNESLPFHPEARAVLWGAALAKIADHYREIERKDRALFFANAAWILSQYPLFAFNAGLLSIDTGDIDRGKQLLAIFVHGYRTIYTTPSFRLLEPNPTADELDRLAEKARSKLAALE